MVAAHPTSDRQCKNAGNKDVASSRVEVLTEMTNIVGSELLGVTLGSARCRDTNSIPSPKAITTGCRPTSLLPMIALCPDTRPRSRPRGSQGGDAVERKMKLLKEAMQQAREGEQAEFSQKL
jgi:hypothetical protein